MACNKPIKGYRKVGGGITFKKHETAGTPLEVPCGYCMGCRIARSREWAVRCMHEASMHEQNAFITLTYNDEHIPHDHGLKKDHFQKFMKRLRKRFGDRRIRYYMAGEYGTAPDGGLGRPHFHALLFGFDFPDKKIWDQKKNLYRSPILEQLWPFGFSSIGAVNYTSAAYVARYIMKKMTGDLAETHYQKVDPETGEIFNVEPEYNSMSLKPGIGKEWYDQFSTDVFPHDFVIQDGKKVPTPRYYLQLLKEEDPDQWELLKKRRREHARENARTDLELENRESNIKRNLQKRKLQ